MTKVKSSKAWLAKTKQNIEEKIKVAFLDLSAISKFVLNIMVVNSQSFVKNEISWTAPESLPTNLKGNKKEFLEWKHLVITLIITGG